MTRPEEALLRLRLNSAELALADAETLVAELHEQLTRAHRACARMARRVKLAPARRDVAA